MLGYPQVRLLIVVLSSSPPSTDSLLPDSAKRIPSNFGNVLSPSDLVGPSPVTSNGTETTEIEDDVSEEVQQAYEAESTSARQSEVSINFDNSRYPC